MDVPVGDPIEIKGLVGFAVILAEFDSLLPKALRESISVKCKGVNFDKVYFQS